MVSIFMVDNRIDHEDAQAILQKKKLRLIETEQSTRM